jgi:hypothetical protein
MVICIGQISLLHTPAPSISYSIIALVCHQAVGKGGAVAVAVSGSAQRYPPRTPMAANLLPVGAVVDVDVVVEDDCD